MVQLRALFGWLGFRIGPSRFSFSSLPTFTPLPHADGLGSSSTEHVDLAALTSVACQRGVNVLGNGGLVAETGVGRTRDSGEGDGSLDLWFPCLARATPQVDCSLPSMFPPSTITSTSTHQTLFNSSPTRPTHARAPVLYPSALAPSSPLVLSDRPCSLALRLSWLRLPLRWP